MTSVSENGLQLGTESGVTLVTLAATTDDKVLAVDRENTLDLSVAAGSPAHGSTAGNVPELLGLVEPLDLFFIILEDFLSSVAESLVEDLGCVDAAAESRKGSLSEGGALVGWHILEVLLGEFVVHGLEDLALFLGTLDAVGLLLDENIGDIGALETFLLELADDLKVVRELSGDCIIKLVTKQADVHSVQHNPADAGEPLGLVKDARIIARDFGSSGESKIEVPGATHDADGALAILGDEGLGETVNLFLVLLLVFLQLTAERDEALLESLVSEIVHFADGLVEVSVAADNVRKRQGKWLGSRLRVLAANILAPGRVSGDELRGKRRHR